MPQLVQIRISVATHKRLKLASALLNQGLAETADELLRESAEAIIGDKSPADHNEPKKPQPSKRRET